MTVKKVSVDAVERLWKIEDLHAFTQIPVSTLKLMTATGEIPSHKIGRHRRYDPVEIRKWLSRKAS